MGEQKRRVREIGFEDLYYVTRSGKIINKKTNRVKVLYGDPYGLENVQLFKKGEKTLFKTYDIWKKVFGEDTSEGEYRGMRKS